MELLKCLRNLKHDLLAVSRQTLGISYAATTLSRSFSKTVEGMNEENEVYSIPEEDYETIMMEKEKEIEKKRNKSRLAPQHQNLIHGKIPYSEPMDDAHLTLQYHRRMFGRYGKQSNINPGSLWPTAEEIKEQLEYESVAYPLGFHETVAMKRAIIEQENQDIIERQQKIVKNLQKLDQWKKEIQARTAKKLADFAKAKAKKDALIEDVRRHFGYKIDPKDEKFKEMLVIKERAQKKKLKEEKSKAKQDRLLAGMLDKES